MGIFVGNKEINTYIGTGNKVSTGIYVGATMVWPMSYTYEISNVVLTYSTINNYLRACGYETGLDYATVKGTVKIYRGSTLIETKTNEPLDVASGNPYIYIDDNKIKAYDRGTTTGATQTIAVTYAYKNTTGGTVNVVVQENQQFEHPATKETTAFTLGDVKFTCDGVTDVKLSGRRDYKWTDPWTSWTSGHKTTPLTGTSYDTQVATVSEWTGSWLYRSQHAQQIGDMTLISAYANSNTSDRSCSLTGTYDGFSSTVTISQWRSAWYEVAYRISGFQVSPASIGATTYGVNNAGILSISSAESNTTTHKDGQIIYGQWIGYTGSITYHFNGTGGNFALSDVAGSQTGRTSITIPYDAAGWRAKVYAKGPNTSATSELSAAIAQSLTETTVTFKQSKAAPSISISPSSLTMSTPDATTGSLTVTSNVDGWTVSSNQSWLTATKSGNIINLSATQHTGSSNRTATVSVSYEGSVRASATVTQNAISISVSPTSLTMSTPDATTGSLTVTSNSSNWTVSSSQSWLTATKSGNTINLSATQHTGSSNRSATVSISYGGSVRTNATVTQNAISISVSPTTLTMENLASTDSLTVTSNSSNWTVSSNQSWLTATKSGNKINLSTTENKGTDNRTATVSVSFGGSVRASATITQKPCAISVSPVSLSPDCFRVEGTLVVTANVTGWTVSSDNEFVYVRKENSSTIYYIVYDNTASISRTATITISYDGTSRATCSVSQAAGYVFTGITESAVTINATSKSFTISVKSQKGSTNVPIAQKDVAITGSTLNPVYSGVTTSTGGQYNVIFTCTENTSTESTRNANIKITQPNSGKQLNWTITQQAKEKQPIDYVYLSASGTTVQYQQAIYIENTHPTNAITAKYTYTIRNNSTGVETTQTGTASAIPAGTKRQIGAFMSNVQTLVGSVSKVTEAYYS